MLNSTIYKQVTSAEEIYKAIYSLESFIFEKHLLNESDYEDFILLQDKYNESYIENFTQQCIKRIKSVLDTDTLFDCYVFFRPKKYDSDSGKVEFRPLHSASLIDQVCMVVLLSVLMFDDSSGKRKLSAISRLLPANFYGNIPSLKVNEVFKPWNRQYKDYSEDTLAANNQFLENKKFKFEVLLDLQRFFPSINPAFVYNYILDNWSINALENDIECIKVILVKLLYFNIRLSTPLKKYYYPPYKGSKNLNYNIGIAQGLPQAYFFGNICMSVISSEIKKQFKGEAFYYVDDSVIFTKDRINRPDIDLLTNNINKRINKYIELPETDNDDILDFQELTSRVYQLNIHQLGKKSECNKIRATDSLSLLATPASTIHSEIRTSQDEFEDIGLLKKAEALLKAVDELIEENKNNKAVLKRLFRFRKFYRNRVNILKHSQSKDDVIDEDDVDSFIRQYGLKANLKDTKFFELLDSDVFLFESQLKAEQLSSDSKLFYKFINSINDFEFKCLNVRNPEKFKDSLYLNRVLTSIFKHPVMRNQKYESLVYSKELNGVRYGNKLTNEQKVNSILIITDNAKVKNG